MDDTDYNQLKQIFKDYDFEDYDSEEEEISKTIRCIINFIEEEPESISIWVWKGDFKTRSWFQEGSEREGMMGKRLTRGFSDLFLRSENIDAELGFKFEWDIMKYSIDCLKLCSRVFTMVW